MKNYFFSLETKGPCIFFKKESYINRWWIIFQSHYFSRGFRRSLNRGVEENLAKNFTDRPKLWDLLSWFFCKVSPTKGFWLLAIHDLSFAGKVVDLFLLVSFFLFDNGKSPLNQHLGKYMFTFFQASETNPSSCMYNKEILNWNHTVIHLVKLWRFDQACFILFWEAFPKVTPPPAKLTWQWKIHHEWVDVFPIWTMGIFQPSSC